MNYHKKLYKLGFRKLSKPVYISKGEGGKWVELPFADEYFNEDRNVRNSDLFTTDPVLNTFKLIIDSTRRIYINISRSGKYQVRVVDDEDKNITYIKEYRGFSKGSIWINGFDGNFWNNILYQLDPDIVREIRFQKLFKQSRRGTKF